MDNVGSNQSEIVAALRRASDSDDARRTRLSSTHAVQLLGTLLLGIGIVFDSIVASVAFGIAGAAAIVVALRRNPIIAEPAVAEHIDLGTGLATTSALPAVLRDDQAMASLTGRLGVLILDVHGAAAQIRAGESRAAQALMATVIHRLQGHSWAYPVGGSFSPLFFVEDPATILIVRRDVLGDQSNQWLTERLRTELDQPMSWGSGDLMPDISIGAAVGPVVDAPALVSLAGLARRDACAGGPGTVATRHFERGRRELTGPVEIEGPNGNPIGLLFEPQDLGPRVGIFEQLAELRSTFTRAIDAVARTGVRPLIGASVTALSHPSAADELISRAVAAGFENRVGIVLPPEFPTATDHRAAETVRRLHDAGFLVLIDRRRSADRIRTMPDSLVDMVLVGDDVRVDAPASLADRTMLIAARSRHLAFAHARGSASEDGQNADSEAQFDDSQALTGESAGGAMRINRGGRVAHPPVATAIAGR